MRVNMSFDLGLPRTRASVWLEAGEFALIPQAGDIVFDDDGMPHNVISRAFNFGAVTTHVEVTCEPLATA
jgi:hypothetical protein